ncbi:mitochondrial dynamin GTPase Msp1 [Lithohypha guttulata]|nr:mitochondrial dynamin GTPase Msp1 [Lithohypha guttulata]
MSLPQKRKALQESESEKQARIAMFTGQFEGFTTVSPANLDQVITQHNICSREDLLLAEAFFQYKYIDVLTSQQVRISRARIPVFEQFSKFLQTTSKQPDTEATAAAASVLSTLLKKEAVTATPHLRDAILYRIGFLAAGQAWWHNSKKECLKVYSKLGYQAVGLFTRIAEATERHLSRNEDRSPLWHKYTNRSSTAPTGPLRPPVENQPLLFAQPTFAPPPPSSPLKSPSRYSQYDGRIEDDSDLQLDRYIYTPDKFINAEDIVPWSAMTAISEDDKFILEAEHRRRSNLYRKARSAFPGILLHGVQGCGKTELIRSWCQKIGATFIRIGAFVEGKLRGQTIRTIKGLYDRAISIADESPVVICFDEADQLMRSDADEHILRLQASLKDIWNDINRANKEIYLFAVTNKPQLISMEDWSRRLYYKWHVAQPQGDAIFEILKCKLEQYSGPIEGLNSVQPHIQHLTPSDIEILISGVETELLKEQRTANSWVTLRDDAGEEWFTNVKEGGTETPAYRGLYSSMNEEMRQRVVPRAIDAEAIIAFVKKGGKKLQSAQGIGELEKHLEFQRKYANYA